jgi:replicative DNA helicase
MSTIDTVQTPSAIAEQNVIGCVLIDNRTIDIVREIVKPEDFYSTCNQVIYRSMCHLEDSGQPINIASVYNQVANDLTFKNAGGIEYLTSCTSSLPSANSIIQFAKIVRGDSLRRKLNAFSAVVKQASESISDDIESDIVRLSDGLLSLTANKLTPWMSFSDVMKEACDVLFNKSGANFIPSGFVDLDDLIAGFNPATLTIIAARPGVGKTAFALNIMQNAVIKYGKTVAFFSLEMRKIELVFRIWSCMASVNGDAIRRQHLSDGEWNRLFDAAEKYRNSKIYIDDTAAIDISLLRERAKRMCRQHGIDMIIVDYLQLMHSCDKKLQGREQEIADISRRLKEISKDLDIPIIALAQLNRECESRTIKKPILSDLRDSGSIEQDADNVLFLYRDLQDSNRANETEVIVAKQRNGMTGTVKLYWSGEFMRFSNLEQDAQF